MNTSHVRRMIAATSLAALAACGTSGNGTSRNPGHTLSIDPATASTRASGSPVKLVAVGSQLTPANISWTLTGPGTLGAATGPSTIYTPPAEGSATVSATITARDGDLTATATVNVGPLVGETVSGRITEAGEPAANVTVLIIGNTPTTTDAQGRFVVHGVQTPYSLVFGGWRDNQLSFAQVDGLTLLNPVISSGLQDAIGGGIVGGPQPSSQSARVEGMLTGAASGPNVRTAFAFDGTSDASAYGLVAQSQYSLDVQWSGAADIGGTIHALQWAADEASLPSSFSGHAGKPLTHRLADGETLSGQDLAFDAVETDTLTASVATSSLAQIVVMRGYEVHLGKGVIALGTEQATSLGGLTGAIAYKTPHLAGATIQLTAMAATINGLSESDLGLSMVLRRNLAVDAKDVAITMPVSPRQASPAKNATGVDTTTPFSWIGSAGVKVVQMSSAGSTEPPPLGDEASSGAGDSTAYFYSVITTKDGVTMPDLSLLGMEMPRGVTFDWSVIVIESLTSTDQLATEGAAQVVAGFETFKVGVSPQWSFTTAP